MYEVIEAVEYVPKPNDIGTSKWVLIKAENGITYQIKFNEEAVNHNTYEFIGNFIGKSIEVPVSNGIFLQIPEFLLTKCEEDLNFTIDRSKVIANIFFGIEWIYGQVQFNDIELLLEELQNTMNYEEFPSIFPYDQYLRNYDRHIDNHLIIKTDKKQQFYYSIDSDKIFGGFPITDILVEKEVFDCFGNPAYKPLYDSINDKIFKIILIYSNKIEALKERELNMLDEYLSDFYGINLDVRNNIKEFLNFRKTNFSEQCISNQSCYENIHRPILIGG
ncbi:MAG: hypothetical protein KGZ62_05645 [Sulfurimonas sp.]|nr:hypothetical protein [Sulfurimonas sp.]